MDKRNLEDLELTEVIIEADPLFPQIKTYLLISFMLPCSTSTIERSFSTLRGVKTWLRSTMNEDRLKGKRMMNIHIKLVSEKMKEFEKM